MACSIRLLIGDPAQCINDFRSASRPDQTRHFLAMRHEDQRRPQLYAKRTAQWSSRPVLDFEVARRRKIFQRAFDQRLRRNACLLYTSRCV